MEFVNYFLGKGYGELDSGRLSAEVIESYPWMDFFEEVDESIGSELLIEGGMGKFWGVNSRAADFIDWYNCQVKSRSRVHDSCGTGDAYAELRAIVGRFGVEDAFGDGDFWVVADSLSASLVSIVYFKKEALPEGMLADLKEWLRGHREFSGISFIDEDGGELGVVGGEGVAGDVGVRSRI